LTSTFYLTQYVNNILACVFALFINGYIISRMLRLNSTLNGYQYLVIAQEVIICLGAVFRFVRNRVRTFSTEFMASLVPEAFEGRKRARASKFLIKWISVSCEPFNSTTPHLPYMAPSDYTSSEPSRSNLTRKSSIIEITRK
uniref:PhoLip_ATPase_C domain-containing protein n=1 Tax=Heligmosomoides polygyrus TaxID=6339 RepID=A0A183G0M3_HELPZ